MCGSIGRAVGSDARGPQFKCSHWKNIIESMVKVEKTKIKSPRLAH